MKELVGIILLTVLVVFGSCNSNTNVSLVGKRLRVYTLPFIVKVLTFAP